MLAGIPELDAGWAESAARVLAGSEFVARTCGTHAGLLAGLVASGDEAWNLNRSRKISTAR